MKQLLLKKGRILIDDVPAPYLPVKNILVETEFSLISTGTELSSVKLSGASLLAKAKERPQEVKKVLDSIKVRGVLRTISLVRDKLDEWKPLGYSASGRVVAVGREVTQFKVGDRVACAGAGIANHAEILSVPVNLTALIPENVDSKEACFVTLGAIAMQGVRRADSKLGETVCVMGLGLIGQITVQLLNASGCRVIGFDPDKKRVELALKNGLSIGESDSHSLNETVLRSTNGIGVDATVITASTPSSEPTKNSFIITRKKGRIVVVGAVGLELERSPFYEKEQDFLISCSYGPGRYDSTYETDGIDYPLPYVRWTENRNMKSFLELISSRKISMSSLIDEVFPIQEAEQAYARLDTPGNKPLSVLLSYSAQSLNGKVAAKKIFPSRPLHQDKIRLALIGVGNFVKTMHLPNIKSFSDRVQITGVCTGNSSSATTLAHQLQAKFSTTNYFEILEDSQVDAVLIATHHHFHAKMAVDALKAGKHVFLEKPLALNREELKTISETINSLDKVPTLVVGFNRRYAPYSIQAKQIFSERQFPLIMTFRVNAGRLPLGHWALGDEGGGRLRGEACHMVDFFRSVIGRPLTNVSISSLSSSDNSGVRPDENFSAQFSYEDGSLGNLIYTSQGDAALPKEFIEIHGGGQSIVIDDFKNYSYFGPKMSTQSNAQDKGHKEIMNVFLNAVRSGQTFPIPWEELHETTQACSELDDSVWGRIS